MSTSVQIDCAPGITRPNDLFDAMCKKLELDQVWFGEPVKSFGEFTWTVKKDHVTDYLTKKDEIKIYLIALHNGGGCRFASW